MNKNDEELQTSMTKLKEADVYDTMYNTRSGLHQKNMAIINNSVVNIFQRKHSKDEIIHKQDACRWKSLAAIIPGKIMFSEVELL